LSKQKHYSGALSRRLLLRYAASLAAVAGTVLLLAAFAVLFLGNFGFWRRTAVLRQLVYWCRDYFLLLFILCTLGGWLAVTARFFQIPLRYLDALAEAAERLPLPEAEPVELPEALNSVQVHLNRAQEQARRDARAARDAEQRKNDLIVYLAHDLKTPLTSVIGYLTLLRDEPQLSQELRGRYTGIALEKAERLEDLINEFFDITRFNLSHLELEKQPVDLTRMLEQTASEFQPILSERGMRCQLTLPPKLPCACDPDKLARVFDNLLRNACYYGFPDTAVRVSGQREEGRVTLVFANQGRTIPQEKLERIFDQFFRLDSSRATRTGGAGLGLAIAREIVELHGGTISARSGEGEIAFTVCLPL